MIPSSATEYGRPRKLSASDDCSTFESGSPDLDDWLKRFALQNQAAGMCTVFVSCLGNRVAGYYALATGGVEPANAPPRTLKGVARHPVPVIVLARLANDVRDRNVGLGKHLLADALRRVDAISQEVGVRALLIHAKDDDARAFYMKNGEFEPSPTDDSHLYLLLKDLRKALTR